MTSSELNNSVIGSIEFGILSPEEIKNMSVVRIFSNKLSGPNSIYDEAMGPIDNGKICPSCGKDNKTCPGHFGHIELNYKIIHPLYYRIVLLFLKCYCVKCSSCLLTPEQLKLAGLLKYQKEHRFIKIVDKCEKIDMCPVCQSVQPKILYVASEGNIYMNYKTREESIRTQLNESEIENIFQNISAKSIKLLGLNPTNTHPKNLILSCLPVIPPIARPYVVSDSVTCDDDLTLQYLEIQKTNNHLEDNSLSESKKAKYIQSLKFRIKCLFDNSQDKAKHTNGRPVKSIKKRITGKEGQIRNNLMGKRVNKSGRTVIGPDPTVGLGEIGIPPEMAKILTYPEKVTNHNIEYLTQLVSQNKANFVQRNDQRINLKYALFRKGTDLLYGDEIERTLPSGKKLHLKNTENTTITLKPGDKLFRNGSELTELEYPCRKEFALRIGDIVQRHLHQGDIVLLNRQPTLHKGSMLAQRIKIIKGKTIRMNLAITKTFNADFDGDEMNIHAPSTPECVAELQELSATKNNLISEQSSKPNITIVQDALLGNYLMTKPGHKMSREIFFQIACAGRGWTPNYILNKIQQIRRVMKAKGKRIQAYTGKGLFSLMLPEDLCYVRENKGNPTEPTVRIHKGVLWEGTINKSILGSSHGSLIQILYKEYSADVAVEFINNVQFIAYAWLLQFGFSIGIDDCVATKTSEIDHVVTKSFVEAQGIEETTTNPLIREVKVTASLSKARDNGMKIAKEALGLENNFVSTVTSGSKGDFFNIAQITGVLGQQNFSGARIPKTMTGCTRTLPFYPLETEEHETNNALSKELEYESRGFIRNSFIHGINPREFWFHAVTGREGVTDTAMKTAQSGYIQRRMVKVGEDVAVKYDGTVRNANESIIQFKYGNNGLDPANTVIVDGKPQICDIGRLADRINLDYES